MGTITHCKFLCLALVIAMWPSFVTSSRTINDEVPIVVRHKQWMANHRHEYKDAVEKEIRFKIFKENVEYIESVNKVGDRKYKLGINKFADLTHEEFNLYHKGLKLPKANTTVTSSVRYESLSVSDVPSSMDWRLQGAVTGVKNQGSRCGCCWAFSAIGAIEGIIKIKTGNLISLSEQELLDCVTGGYGGGCNGGYMDTAFQFVAQNGGIASEDSYPYMAMEGTCTNMPSVATISGYEDVPANSESSLLVAVARQPVSVTIDGTARDFQFYSAGILTADRCGTYLDHAVTAIGYGVESDGTKYWLVKNSWGETWGEGGYAKFERDVAEAEGVCGIAMRASYPIV